MTVETIKFAGPFSEREAWDRAEAACMAFAREKGRTYPIFATLADVIGKVPAALFTSPDRYATHFLTTPTVARDTGDYYLMVLDEMEGLRAGTEVVEGREVTITRAGALLSVGELEDAPVRAR